MIFTTLNLVEAALMRMRLKRDPECKWASRPNQCTFTYKGVTEEDVEYARSDPSVPARAFNLALVQVKTAMYSAKDE